MIETYVVEIMKVSKKSKKWHFASSHLICSLGALNQSIIGPYKRKMVLCEVEPYFIYKAGRWTPLKNKYSIYFPSEGNLCHQCLARAKKFYVENRQQFDYGFSLIGLRGG